MPETKEFTMLEKTDTITATGTEAVVQPRTYKVTRSQMKEIHDSLPDREEKSIIYDAATRWFSPFKDETEIDETRLGEIFRCFDGPNDLIKSIFPEYFFIPEGEPVLVRQADCNLWNVRISDGNGGVYVNGHINGASDVWHQTIPFTKNPPK